MPTSPLYDSTRALLATRLPDVRDSQRETLWEIVGLLHQDKVKSPLVLSIYFAGFHTMTPPP